MRRETLVSISCAASDVCKVGVSFAAPEPYYVAILPIDKEKLPQRALVRDSTLARRKTSIY
jgi:hypothetical protein